MHHELDGWKDAASTRGVSVCFAGFDGRDDKIRTCDLTHPKGALYQAEPRPDVGGTGRFLTYLG